MLRKLDNSAAGNGCGDITTTAPKRTMEEQMTKSQLTTTLATQRGLPLYKAEVVVDNVFAAMAEALGEGDRIEVRGFGSFAIREYRPYTGRNPKTGESIAVKPKKLPFFKAGKELREYLASNY
jgi:integration host factor subunit beta